MSRYMTGYEMMEYIIEYSGYEGALDALMQIWSNDQMERFATDLADEFQLEFPRPLRYDWRS